MINHDLSGDLSEYVYRKFCDTYGTFSLGSQGFRLAYLEEAQAVGYSAEDFTILIRRESDGAMFEVELEATVRPVPTEAEREHLAQQLAGQMTLTEASGA